MHELHVLFHLQMMVLMGQLNTRSRELEKAVLAVEVCVLQCDET